MRRVIKIAECIYYFPKNLVEFFNIKHRVISREYDWMACGFKNTCKCGAQWYWPIDEELVRKPWLYDRETKVKLNTAGNIPRLL